MAVKNNLYDAMNYAGQVKETARAHRRDMKKAKDKGIKGESKAKTPGDSPLRKPDSGEFLGGFWKEDRLIPSVTVTVYFGNEEWDGPLSLFDMMDATDPKLFACMDNYHVRLIAPALMPDSEIEKFQSNLREVLLFIKYSKDKEKLRRILKSNEKRFKEVERRAADVIEVITNQRIKYDEKEMKIDVCQAIEEMREESQREGEKIGEERGRQIGALENARENARNFYRLGVEIGKIAEGVGYDLDTVKQWLGLST